MTFRLTVFSHRNGKICNPTPYKRTTQNSHWSKAYKQYNDWRNHIMDMFQVSYPDFYDPKYLTRASRRKPIVDPGPWEVNVIVYYMNKTHGDTDNVAKGINDALFVNDKLVFGTYLYRYDKTMPRVEILVTKRAIEELWANPDLDARYAVSRQPIQNSLTPTSVTTVTSG